MILLKITIALLFVWLMTISLVGCTMTMSFDTLESGSQTTASYSKNSASRSVSQAGLDVLSSQGSSAVADQVLQNSDYRQRSNVSNRYRYLLGY